MSDNQKKNEGQPQSRPSGYAPRRPSGKRPGTQAFRRTGETTGVTAPKADRRPDGQANAGKQPAHKPQPQNRAGSPAHGAQAEKKRVGAGQAHTRSGAAGGSITSGVAPQRGVTYSGIKPRNTRRRDNRGDHTPLRIISLGGLGEIGKNMTVLEYGEDILVIDSGVAFPDEDMLGVDLVIPDITYLTKNMDRVRGIVITHGHEDHIGALPYVLQQLNVPVFCTRLTAGIITNKLKEFRFSNKPDLRVVKAGETIRLGVFRVEFIHVNHSIPDACALSVTTPVGVIFHTGDFKLDTNPIDGRMMDITRIGEIGNAGVLLLMCESTNAERPGYTPSERTVGTSFETIFSHNKEKRVVIATFSSNVHRVQQIIDAAVRHKRKVAIMGRSMVNVIGAATELGYMRVPEGTLIDINEIKRFKPSQLCLITTGSQGEPMSALYRMAFGENDRVKLTSSDIVVLSSHPIPGNEKLVGKVINALVKGGIEVYNTSSVDVHVSGHACQEELKLMMALVHPTYLMPVHGEERHLSANSALGQQMGIPRENIVISDLGKVVELDADGWRFNGTVPAGKVFVDGAGVGDVGAVVLRERKLLGEDGMIAVVAAVNSYTGDMLSPVDITSRGFVYSRDADQMMEEARAIAEKTINRYIGKRKVDMQALKTALRDELQKFFYRKTKRQPVILPIILDT